MLIWMDRLEWMNSTLCTIFLSAFRVSSTQLTLLIFFDTVPIDIDFHKKKTKTLILSTFQD